MPSTVKKASKRLMEVAGYPRKIIRIYNFSEREQAEKDAKRVQAMFAELKNEYQIPVAVEVVLGQDNKNPAMLERLHMFLITDRIDGERLYDKKFSLSEKAEAWKQLNQLFTNLARYLIDKHQQKDVYLWDIFTSDQYVYGKRWGKSNDRPWLVDVDLLVSDFGKKDLMNVVMNVGIRMSALTWFIETMEKQLGTKFAEPRQIILNFLKQLSPDEISEWKEGLMSDLISALQKKVV